MGLRGFLSVLRRRVWLFSAVLLVCVLGGGAVSLLTTPSYTATAGLYFSVRNAADADDLAQGSNFTQQAMGSYASVATTASVLEPVARELQLSGGAVALGEQVSVRALNATAVLEISVDDSDATQAARLANAIADQMATTVAQLAPKDEAGESGVTVTLVAPATEPRSPSSPNTKLDLAAGLVLGLALGVGLVLVRESLDTRVRDLAEVARLTDRPVIGSLGVDAAASRRVAVAAEPHSAQAEAYRQLRTNLQFLHVGDPDAATDGHRVLAVTSSVANEGKSTVTVNLSLALAETGARVLLVDADLRRPSVAGMLGLEGAAGLTTVLLGDATVADVVQEWGTTGMHVLTAGVVPPNPTELLGSPAMRRLLAGLGADYDFVLLDSAPLLPVADGAVLSRLVDGAILVANVTMVRQHQLGESLRDLDRVDAPLLGIVLNQVARDQHAYAYRSSEADVGRAAGWADRLRRPGRRSRASRPRDAGPAGTRVLAPGSASEVRTPTPRPVAPVPVDDLESPVAMRR